MRTRAQPKALLIGREREQEELQHALDAPGPQLIAVRDKAEQGV